MKHFLSFICVMGIIPSFAQRPATIKTIYTDTIIQPDRLTKDSVAIYEIPVTLQLKGRHNRDTTVPVAIKMLSSGSIIPEIKDNTLRIPASSWEADSSKTTFATSILLKVKYTKQFNKDVYISLSVPGSDTVQQVTVSSFGAYSPGKPFWVEIGTNFDLIDGIQPNNLFGGVFMYRRDLRNFCKHGSKNIGLFAGIYESKSISSRKVGDSNYTAYHDKSQLRLITNNLLPVFRDSGAVVSLQTVRNISLFFSPQLRLTNHSANSEGIHIFVSAWFELQWQRITTEYDYAQMKRIDTLWLSPEAITKIPVQKYRTETDFRTHYVGFGLPVYFKEDDVNAFFNPTIGGTNQPFGERLLNEGKRKWSFFYTCQFRLNEEKYGFALTGEVRGLIRKDVQPIVSLALTKKFDLTKLIEFK